MASPFNRSCLHALCGVLVWPYILSATTQFITSGIESIKLQSSISPPKRRGALNVLPKHEMMLSMMSDRSIKKGE